LQDPDIQNVADWLRSASHVAVLTGAGISVESGLATFRDRLTGMWAKFDPEELATQRGFRKNPELVWQWYMDRRATALKCLPNPGHRALSWLQGQIPQLSLITQNVDRLHQAAGSRDVIELHGSIHEFKCFDNSHSIELSIVEASPDAPPFCPVCQSLVRPDVVWFGEMLPPKAIQAAIRASETADLFFVIGTSGMVQPAASLGMTARSRNAKVVVINPDPDSAMPGCTFLQGPSGKILPELMQLAWGVSGTQFQVS
jgi:NAD-dependent deacetylase